MAYVPNEEELKELWFGYNSIVIDDPVNKNKSIRVSYSKMMEGFYIEREESYGEYEFPAYLYIYPKSREDLEAIIRSLKP